MKIRTLNLHPRTLHQFTPSDTVYAARVIGGFQHIFFGNFVGLNRGTVTIFGVWIQPDEEAARHDNVQRVERFRADKCFLWGKSPNDSWPRCHWFKRGVDFPAS